MVTKDTVNAEIDKIYTMLMELRNDMFYQFKSFKNKESDRFNAVSWELSCLKNLIKEL
jgi:hypothetical protein